MNLDKYRAVMFDLFHTLTSADVLRVPGKGTSEILGVGREKWNNQLLVHSDARLRGKITDPYVIIEKMAHAIDPAIPDDVIMDAVKNRTARFRHALVNIEEATIATLQKLKQAGKRLGLVSNADVNEISGWDQSPLKPYFKSVVFSCRVGYVKPEKEIYELALKQLNAQPGDVLYVGDGGSDELMGAQRIGMHTVLTVHVIRQFWPDRIVKARAHADYEIDRIEELVI